MDEKNLELNSKFSGTLTNCYDSHVHWQATGTYHRRLPQYTHQGEWITGFGWDQPTVNEISSREVGATPPGKTPHEILDREFGDHPVFFVRIDGHAAWVNQAGLARAGLWQKNPVAPLGGEIQLKSDGYPTGILLDQAMQIVQRLLPPRTESQIRDDLLLAQEIFHKSGFTHIRDLSGDEVQWQVINGLLRENKIKLAVEQFFEAEDPNLFDRQLDLAIRLQRDYVGFADSRTQLVRPRGVKIYLDGALGSEGALLSCDYCSGRPGARGLQMLKESTLRDFISRAWSARLPIAVHAIGDAANHLLAQTAFAIESSGLKGELNIEHAELLRYDTILLLSKLSNVKCYMQPCQWLTDKKWLETKIGPLVQRVFRWRELEEHNIPIWFGSDTPIEEPSFIANLAAIEDGARNGDIPRPKRNVSFYQMHPDSGWVRNTSTVFTNGHVSAVHFCGNEILL